MHMINNKRLDEHLDMNDIHNMNIYNYNRHPSVIKGPTSSLMKPNDIKIINEAI